MSSVHRYRSTWRSLTFNQVYDNSGVTDDPAHLDEDYANSDFRLDSWDATRVESQDYRELRQWLEGAEANEAYEGVMVALGSGIIIASSYADLEDKTQLLRSQFSIASCRLAAEATDPVGVLPFDFRRATAVAPGYLDLRMYARPAAARPVVIPRKMEGLSRRFRFSLVSFDPRFVSQAEVSTSTPTASTTYSITNAGDVYTHPILTIVVSSGTNSASWTLNGTTVFALTNIPTGTWTLDTRRSTITRTSDSANGYPYRSSGYLSNFRLNPGANSLVRTGSGLSAVTVTHRHAYA